MEVDMMPDFSLSGHLTVLFGRSTPQNSTEYLSSEGGAMAVICPLNLAIIFWCSALEREEGECDATPTAAFLPFQNVDHTLMGYGCLLGSLITQSTISLWGFG